MALMNRGEQIWSIGGGPEGHASTKRNLGASFGLMPMPVQMMVFGEYARV